ncbi:unnamed protein product, partial [Brassica oleracea]
ISRANEGDSQQKTTPPSSSSLDAGRASGCRRQVLCTAVYSLPTPLQFIVVFISRALVPFASHVAVSSDPVTAVTSSNLLLVAAPSPVPLLVTAHPITASRSAGSTLLELTGSAHFLAPPGSPFGAQPEHSLFCFSLSPELAIRCHVSLPFRTLVKNPQRWVQSHRSIGVDIQIVMGLWLCLGSVESKRSRYGNIGILVLTLTSASIPPLSTAKSITALTLRLYWFFISKYRHFRPLLLSDLFEIHIVSSESFLGGSNCRHLRLRYQGSVRQLPPTLSTILFDSKPNLLMESEMKKVSAASPSRLLIFLLPGSREIHLVSRSNTDGCRAVLFRLTGSVTSIGFPPLFQPLSLGYFNVCSDYSKLFRAVVSRIQVKVIRRFLYFELVSPFNTSIPCCIVFLLLLFILPLSIPLVVVVETL